MFEHVPHIRHNLHRCNKKVTEHGYSKISTCCFDKMMEPCKGPNTVKGTWGRENWPHPTDEPSQGKRFIPIKGGSGPHQGNPIKEAQTQSREPSKRSSNPVKGTQLREAQAQSREPNKGNSKPVKGTQLREAQTQSREPSEGKLKPSQGGPVKGSSNPVKGSKVREAQAQSREPS